MKSRGGNSHNNIITVLAPVTAVKMEVNGQTEILVPVNGQNEFQRLYNNGQNSTGKDRQMVHMRKLTGACQQSKCNFCGGQQSNWKIRTVKILSAVVGAITVYMGVATPW